ncbi:MAG: glycosyl transferase group 1 [uncultured bacterium]|nr:MAG: glycosyl transferase group 1 [uncultured bacterium]
MKHILIIHNFYKLSNIGGEDRVVIMQKELLEKKGIKVTLYDAYNDNIVSFKDHLQTFINSYFNYKAYNNVYKIIKEQKVDTVLIHNTFPLLSHSVILAAKKANTKVYMYLHNYRWLCCGDNLFINGQICHKCQNINSFYHSFNNKCYKNGPLSLWRESVRILGQNIIKKNVDIFICPSNTVKEIFASYGFDKYKLKVLPHFVEDVNKEYYPKTNISSKPCFIIVGRLDAYKGIQTILEGFKLNNHNLKIIGNGPLRSDIEKACKDNDNIEYLGVVTPEETRSYISNADFLIQASECYETFGLTIAEAYSVGTPVIGSNLGTRKELIIEGRTGFLFDIGDYISLNQAVDKSIYIKYKEFSKNCINSYQKFFTKDCWYKNLVKIMQELYF